LGVSVGPHLSDHVYEAEHGHHLLCVLWVVDCIDFVLNEGQDALSESEQFSVHVLFVNNGHASEAQAEVSHELNAQAEDTFRKVSLGQSDALDDNVLAESVLHALAKLADSELPDLLLVFFN